MSTKSLVIYYDDEDVDLKALIQKLTAMQDSRYYQRSMSAVGRMLLEEALQRALEMEEVADNSLISKDFTA